MRRTVNYVLIMGMLICVLLSGCEFLTPKTSSALSQTQQEQELQKQTGQLEQQTEAIKKLADSVEKLVDRQTPSQTNQN